MDAIISNEDPTVGQAFEALAGWEQESAPSAPGADPTLTAGNANQPDASATGDGSDQTEQSPAGDGTLADKQTPEAKQDQSDPKPGDKPADAKAKTPEATPQTSKYEKAKERLNKTWDEVNKEKEFVRSTRAELQAKEATLKQREETLNQREAKLSAPKFKPEDYEGHASKLEAEAQKLDEAGEYTKAERLRGKAEDAREYAKQLRENPPQPDPTEAQRAETFKAQQKEWWGKAAIDFPDVVKEGTPQRAALINLLKVEPTLVNDPKGMYYASRLVNAETVSARVPSLEQQLTAAAARIKELESLTAVDHAGSVNAPRGPKAFSEMSFAEQLASVEAEAQGIGQFQ